MSEIKLPNALLVKDAPIQDARLKVLSIDASWIDASWSWNAWYTVGEISLPDFEALKTTRSQIKWFRDNDFITEQSKGKVAIDDAQYNLTLINKDTRQPLFAIEYGLIY